SILIQITAPAVVIGLLLFGACLASVWSINHLQRNLANILSRNVTSLEAAQELEIKLRQLRFHSLVYVMDPQPTRQLPIDAHHQGFEAALTQAQSSAHQPEERTLVAAIQAGYQRYRAELAQGAPGGAGKLADYIDWADTHPVRHLLTPCQELLRVNKE